MLNDSFAQVYLLLWSAAQVIYVAHEPLVKSNDKPKNDVPQILNYAGIPLFGFRRSRKRPSTG